MPDGSESAPLTGPAAEPKPSAPVAVAFCADMRMEAPLHVAALSLFRHLAPGVVPHFYLLLTDFDEAARSRIRRTLDLPQRAYELTFLPGGGVDLFRGASALHGSRATYLRLRLAELIDAPRFLYLDADTLATTDVAPLFSADMGDYAAGFVVDNVLYKSLDFDLLLRLGKDLEGPAFNSGVMLVQVERWREQRCRQRIANILARHGPGLQSHDQTVLHILFSDDCFHLPGNFNRKILPRFGQTMDRGPGIYHFVGSPKPWDAGARLVFPHSRIWFEALHQTALSPAKKRMWRQKAYWSRIPHLLGGYKRAIQKGFAAR